MEEEGDHFCFPAMPCDDGACGGSWTVCMSACLSQ